MDAVDTYSIHNMSIEDISINCVNNAIDCGGDLVELFIDVIKNGIIVTESNELAGSANVFIILVMKM